MHDCNQKKENKVADDKPPGRKYLIPGGFYVLRYKLYHLHESYLQI